VNDPGTAADQGFKHLFVQGAIPFFIFGIKGVGVVRSASHFSYLKLSSNPNGHYSAEVTITLIVQRINGLFVPVWEIKTDN
jgi:hypothetical protein